MTIKITPEIKQHFPVTVTNGMKVFPIPAWIPNFLRKSLKRVYHIEVKIFLRVIQNNKPVNDALNKINQIECCLVNQ